MNRLESRVVRLERRSDMLAEWRGVPVDQCPDDVLVAVLGEAMGWPRGYEPSDDELVSAIEQHRDRTA